MIAIVLLSCVALATSDGIHQPQPYKFGYSIKDHHGEHREESGNGAGAVVGNYGFTDDRGIARQVNYVADHGGFRAQVKTNEPGTANQSPAAVRMISNDPYPGEQFDPIIQDPMSHLSFLLMLSSDYLVDMVMDLMDMDMDPAEMVFGYGGYGNLWLWWIWKSWLWWIWKSWLWWIWKPLAMVDMVDMETKATAMDVLLGYNGGYGGIVNFGAPLVGGGIRGYDSRFVTQA
ncbi:cuticle protein 16.8 [Caerostris extrusa]|uniref:Cuticle protein 16.8 n=1 Tax=Caerostris extrusa TaxID=172846 RepID=A0AAV4W205_CAEEX|nr:cuticle protein 16.8 [Caerostris extrusa]